VVGREARETEGELQIPLDEPFNKNMLAVWH
jgi:hypothetical protein